jgi:hypothetical protein
MTLEDLVGRLVDALDQAKIDYMLVGSLSTSFYGVSRGTQDADIVVSCHGSRFAGLLKALGDEFVAIRSWHLKPSLQLPRLFCG